MKNKRRQPSRNIEHELTGADLAAASPVIDEKPPKSRRAGHVHLRHHWEGKRGHPNAFAPERIRQLQRELQDWLRRCPKPQKMDAAAHFIQTRLSAAERESIKISTIKTYVVRPLYARLKNR
jgi:hypothetical protein